MNRSPRAFTLIEVLLAVFIIALGAIGLFALFAGVAEQQRRAAEVTQAVGITQKVVGVLRSDRVGPLQEPGDPSSVPPLSEPFPDPKFGETLRPDVWHPAFVYDQPTRPQYGYTLSIAPADASAPDESRFFLIDVDEVEIYSNPPQRTGPSLNPTSGPVGVIPGWNAPDEFHGREVLAITDRRIDPGSLRVTFFVANQADGSERALITFDDGELLTRVPALGAGEYDNVVIVHPEFPSARITMNYGLRAWGSPPNDPVGLRAFNLAGVPIALNEWVSSIRVRYRYRNDRLLSLNDRLVTVPDAEAPGGRRAEFGTTVFYRRTGSGATQVAVLTYAVRPLVRGGEFIPPEGWQEFTRNEGLVREAEVRLGFDEDAQLYYIEPLRADQGFLARSDQILLFGGDRGQTLQPPPLRSLGADQPVRVTRIVGDPSLDLTATRLYLDGAPRAGFRALNGRRDQTANLPVFALSDTVRSLDARGTRWQVRPVEMRIIDIR